MVMFLASFLPIRHTFPAADLLTGRQHLPDGQATVFRRYSSGGDIGLADKLFYVNYRNTRKNTAVKRG
jgi:hypothetical protein